jgi:hypothetical protein
MNVMENNRFEHVRRGIVVSSPLNWLLLRKNVLQTIDPEAPALIDETRLAGHDHGARDIIEAGDSR